MRLILKLCFNLIINISHPRATHEESFFVNEVQSLADMKAPKYMVIMLSSENFIGLDGSMNSCCIPPMQV